MTRLKWLHRSTTGTGAKAGCCRCGLAGWDAESSTGSEVGPEHWRKTPRIGRTATVRGPSQLLQFVQKHISRLKVIPLRTTPCPQQTSWALPLGLQRAHHKEDRQSGRNSPGTLNCWPKTSSAEEDWRSSIEAEHRPNMTPGRQSADHFQQKFHLKVEVSPAVSDCSGLSWVLLVLKLRGRNVFDHCRHPDSKMITWTWLKVSSQRWFKVTHFHKDTQIISVCESMKQRGMADQESLKRSNKITELIFKYRFKHTHSFQMQCTLC